jgi:hypothetical protein
MIAKGFISLNHTNSKDNLADVVTKHWSYNSVKELLKPVFYHEGDTSQLYIDDESYDPSSITGNDPSNPDLRTDTQYDGE